GGAKAALAARAQTSTLIAPPPKGSPAALAVRILREAPWAAPGRRFPARHLLANEFRRRWRGHTVTPRTRLRQDIRRTRLPRARRLYATMLALRASGGVRRRRTSTGGTHDIQDQASRSSRSARQGHRALEAVLPGRPGLPGRRPERAWDGVLQH